MKSVLLKNTESNKKNYNNVDNLELQECLKLLLNTPIPGHHFKQRLASSCFSC